METSHCEPHREAEGGRPVAGSGTGRAPLGLHLVQGGGIETAGEAMVDRRRAESPSRGGGRRRPVRVRGKLKGRVYERAAFERGNVRAQTCQQRRLAPLQIGPLRNGEEGLAVPVRARRPKPDATHTQTWARLWPRDPLETGGRWGGGWGRLVHGDALATRGDSGARVPLCSFFVLDSFAPGVKPKNRTIDHQMFLRTVPKFISAT